MEKIQSLAAFDGQFEVSSFSEVHRYHKQAEVYLAQGLTHAAQQTLAQAYALLTQATKVRKPTSDQPNFGTLTLTLARIYQQEQRYPEADAFFKDALNHLLAEGRMLALGHAYFAYGEALKERGNYQLACHYLSLAYLTHRNLG